MRGPIQLEDDANEWRIWLTENAKRGIDFLAKTIAATVAKRVAASSLKWIEDSSSPAGDSWPRITKRLVAKISPWVDLVAREVEFSPRTGSQTYHSVATFDYVIVLAVTPDGRIPLVRQYRPAVEGMTLELPAGTVDTGEDPAATAIRELLEETGLPSKAVHLLGINKTDAGRLSNRVYSYFVRAGDQIAGFRPEEGVAVGFVTPSELVGAVRSGELDAQADLGTILLAELFGHLVLRY